MSNNSSNESLLYFNYLNLDKTLNKFYKNGLDNVDIQLLISLEKDYYMGENMKLIMSDLRRLMNNKEIVWNINGKLEKFKVNKMSLIVGDVINRYIIYYRYCVDYFDKHNINKESLIPLEIRKDFEEKSYIEGKEEGKDWFKSNIDAFNLFSNEKVLTKDYYIGDDITTIFEETEDTPKLEYICYEHWYKQPEYKKIEEPLLKMINDPECSAIDRCYTHEAEYFYERLKKRNKTPKYKDLFIQQSRKYLIDETVPFVLNTRNCINNIVEFYYYGKSPMHLEVYKGRGVKNNKTINSYIRCYSLDNIGNNNRVSVRNKSN